MTRTIADIDLLEYRASEKTVWVFLRVADSAGAVGWGEATLAGQETQLATAHAKLEPTLRGTAADSRRNLLTELGAAISDRAIAAIVSAVDQALWDLDGQHSGSALHVMLGASARSQVPLYANINRRTLARTPEGFAASAQKAMADGFGTFKIAPFDGVSPGSAAGIAHGIACATAVRDAIGPARALYVDCHWRFDETNAVDALDALAEIGIGWFECPLPERSENFAALGRLRARANARGILLAGCETETALAGFMPYIERGLYDVLMPDVKYAGGLAEMARISDCAARHGVAIAPHNPSGPISHAYSLHLGATLAGFSTLEHQYDETPAFFDIATGDLPRPANGTSRLPGTAGLGVGLDPDVLANIGTIASGTHQQESPG
ncbi:MAG: mandelate racemase/muconate lactonizing enzyme family protein [Telmatospirillum sp.]|nr:mandelate racemase/muconate lactonizing enzyme family protein [Telmatospirillum sp.]